jgi:hypothetical protein
MPTKISSNINYRNRGVVRKTGEFWVSDICISVDSFITSGLRKHHRENRKEDLHDNYEHHKTGVVESTLGWFDSTTRYLRTQSSSRAEPPLSNFKGIRSGNDYSSLSKLFLVALSRRKNINFATLRWINIVKN